MKSLFKKVRARWHGDINSYLCRDEMLIKNIFSYIQNEVALKWGGVNESQFNYHKALHQLLHVRRITDNFKYERLGKNNDGGYIAVSDKNGSLSSSKIAYSFGIADDVSFDLDLAARGYEVFQYDHTIEKLPQNNGHFHWKKSGLAASSNPSQKLETLENMLKANGHEHSSGIFLKMDIEGYEWEVFNSLSSDFLEKFDQIVIELHDNLDYDEKVIEKHLSALAKIAQTHQAVHVHANNAGYVNYCGNLVTPDLIEVTYVLKNKYKFSDDKVKNVRLSLDHPNVSGDDLELGFWNVEEN